MAVASKGLLPHHVSGEIRVTAPNLHFLTGRSLARLHDGAAVPFDFQLVVFTGSGTAGSPNTAASANVVVARALERFVVSYDVWEEKFSVVRARDFRRSGMRLSASSAESWCLENLFVLAASLPAGQQLGARLEIRTAESKEFSPANSGINLATLIEIFSRPSRPQQDRWSVDSAPFQLADLKP
jgi:hypothetical protein